MLVYGDRRWSADPRALLEALRERTAGKPLDREALVAALIAAGELAQGLADGEFEALGCDDLTPIQQAAMAATFALARRLGGQAADVAGALEALAAQALPPRISIKLPEGYAFYAVSPQSYLAAARAWPWAARPLVIGLRSIGTSLAAAVAAGAGAEAPISVRPTGHPFDRELRVSERLRARLAAHAGPFAIVDEGPGLSGSSFASAAKLLARLGVAEDRMVFFPNHAGDVGAEAPPERRAFWARAQRAVAQADPLNDEPPLRALFEDLVGPATAAEELSAGAWRRGWWGPAPPAWPRLERIKLKLATPGGAYVARFAGLGEIGAEKLERAGALAAAGFTPEPIALRRGFLLERWVEGEPLSPDRPDRAAFLAHLARYLAFRARAFPAEPEAGASLGELREMIVANAGEALAAGLSEPAEARPRVKVDGKLEPWEWRRLPGGGFCKTDALDHCVGHDLVGCQEIAWDIAGAAVEFRLSEAETRSLVAVVEPTLSPERLAFFIAAYAAFRLGLWTLAGEAAAAGRYAAVLREMANCTFPLPSMGRG